MSDREQAIELVSVAERDLRALKGMLDRATFATEVFGFTAQQAVEKALKAWLCRLGVEYPYIHDIGDLLTLLEDNGQAVGGLWDFDDLTTFAGHARYGVRAADRDPFDRRDVITRVESLVARIRSLTVDV